LGKCRIDIQNKETWIQEYKETSVSYKEQLLKVSRELEVLSKDLLEERKFYEEMIGEAAIVAGDSNEAYAKNARSVIANYEKFVELMSV
jgi:hypothetical protein